MINISKQVIFNNEIASAVNELMTYKMTLHYCERLSELKSEFTSLYNTGKSIFYLQVVAWGGEMHKHSKDYTFEDPIKKQLFEAELYTFLSGTKEMDRAPVIVYIDGVPQELKDTLLGIVDIRPNI